MYISAIENAFVTFPKNTFKTTQVRIITVKFLLNISRFMFNEVG